MRIPELSMLSAENAANVGSKFDLLKNSHSFFEPHFPNDAGFPKMFMSKTLTSLNHCSKRSTRGGCGQRIVYSLRGGTNVCSRN